MVKRNKGPTSPVVASLVHQLRIASRENEVGIWRSISKTLQKPRRNRSEVNISKINRFTKKDEAVVVPGKVLAAGELDHPVIVAAVGFSQRAKEKIEAAEGRALSIMELVDENPKGSGVKILG